MGEFGVGQPVPRLEDPALLTGRGLFADDAGPGFEGALRGYVLRSPHANARFRRSTFGSRRRAGRRRGADRAGLYRRRAGTDPPHRPPVERRGGGAPASPPYFRWRDGHARHVGDGVAFIVADTLEARRTPRNGSRSITSPSPRYRGRRSCWRTVRRSSSTAARTTSASSTRSRPRRDRCGFRGARNVVRRRFLLSRVLANAMEPRGCVADYDPRARRLFLRACPAPFRRAHAARRPGVRRRRAEHPRRGRRRRRQFRHQGQRLSGIPAVAVGGAPARPAGALGERTLGRASERLSRARQRHRRGTGARRGQPLRRPSRTHRGQSGRLPVAARRRAGGEQSRLSRRVSGRPQPMSRCAAR